MTKVYMCSSCGFALPAFEVLEDQVECPECGEAELEPRAGEHLATLQDSEGSCEFQLGERRFTIVRSYKDNAVHILTTE
jgi:rubredoxin